MNVVFMGTPEFSVPALRALAAAGHDILCVYTQPPRPAGRGKKERPTPVHKAADLLGLPVRHPKSLRGAAEQSAFTSLNPDVAVVVAYGLILPQEVLAAPKFGCLNIHASLLPRWRGAAPIHRAVITGDAETGIAIMQMEAGLDTGPVLLEARTPIAAEDTTGDLHDRLSEIGAALIVESLSRLGQLVPKPQSDDGVTYAAKIDKAEARVDWTEPSEVVDRQIRGLSPHPGAWTLANGERVKLLRSRIIDATGAPGEHLGEFRIACGQGAIEVLEAQRQGKAAMARDAFLRGFELPKALE